MSAIKNRYDFVILFDVKDGNPNGDPDAGNLPRVDPETGHGLVTDVCLKRKIRNYVMLSRAGAPGYDIYVKEKAVLTAQQGLAYAALGLDGSPKGDADERPRKAHSAEHVERARDWMCRHFYDVRAFGAVMGLKENNAGQVRGPVQLTFARSIDPIYTAEHVITRMAVATQAEADKQGGDNRTMGRKSTVPYGLYRTHGFVSPPLARQTHFGTPDLALLWEAILNMFDHDRSAARGLLAVRDLIVFEHASELGSAPAHKLFDQVEVRRKEEKRPPRDFSEYTVTVGALPAGVTRLAPAL